MPGSTSVLDTFNRSDSTTTLGSNWSLVTDFGLGDLDLGISSNQAYRGSGGGFTVMAWNPATFGPACEAYITVAAEATSGQNFAIYARLQQLGAATFDGYNITYTVGSPDAWAAKRSDNGVDTQLGASVNQAVAAGEKVLIECNGTTIKGFLFTGGSWVEILSRTDSTYANAGNIGFYGAGDGTWRYDDFGGGTLLMLSPRTTVVSGQQPLPGAALSLRLSPRDQIANIDPRRSVVVSVGTQPLPGAALYMPRLLRLPTTDPRRSVVASVGWQPLPGAILYRPWWLRDMPPPIDFSPEQQNVVAVPIRTKTLIVPPRATEIEV